MAKTEKRHPFYNTLPCRLVSMCFLAVITMIIFYVNADSLIPTITKEIVIWEQDRHIQTTLLQLRVTRGNKTELTNHQMPKLRESEVISQEQMSHAEPSVLKYHPKQDTQIHEQEQDAKQTVPLSKEALLQKQQRHAGESALKENQEPHSEREIVSEQERHNEPSDNPKELSHTELLMQEDTDQRPQFKRKTLSQKQERQTEPSMQEDNRKQQFERKMLSQERERHVQPTAQRSYQKLLLLPKDSGITPTSQEEKVGYLLALAFSDQGTGSFVNIMSFLCFAAELGGVRVVEPFLIGSIFGQFMDASQTEKTKFSDVFDSDVFNSFALSREYSPLTSYDTFLKNAPRKLLVAQYQCSGSRCRSCGHKDVLEKGQIFSKLNGFEMVGHVCLNYGPSLTLTYKEIEKQLYATYNRSEVVILFIRFGGVNDGQVSVKGGYRLFMNQTPCNRNQFFEMSKMRPSQLVKTSADKYINRYLTGKRYISVMVRIEMIVRSADHFKSRFNEVAPNLTKQCLHFLLRRLEYIKRRYHTSTIFLCLDVGAYGSKMFRDEQFMNPILPLFDDFVSETVKTGMTLSEWDNTFSNVTLIQEPGFVAVMQKYIAARGDVLVLLGGDSSFQASTQELYTSLHSTDYNTVYDYGQSCVEKVGF